MTPRSGIFTLFACVIALFIMVLSLASVIVKERAQSIDEIHFQPNRMFSDYEDVDFVCISLEKRVETHFKALQQKLAPYHIELTHFPAIDGKKLNLEDFPMTPYYREHFLSNQRDFEQGKTKTFYRGHLGCAVSHLQVIKNMKHMTVIFEDDANPQPNFRRDLQTALASVSQLDPEWEILLLGFSANYDDYHFSKLNDREPIYEGNIVRVVNWIGGWSYVVRNQTVAQKILNFFQPMRWHYDLVLAEESRNNNLRVYGTMPTISNHVGHMRISSWNFTQVGQDIHLLKSDTNH